MATLSNYQLGDLLGRGASGNVYRALNFLTGETVAIKSISLLSLTPSLLPDIMSEIDLLKNLNHPNIVKYKGFARDKENLFIVLEYCENGSLQTILKKFGKFPESLVAVYISQVLQGLIYLHEQGVIHRDIKGANILTNKDGSVKLADFGVSSRATAPLADSGDAEVVGSPYWMAPEVIEQSGASTASDIWSVGCVVVELMEGKPPYGDLAPMQALWRIVQDEGMRVPEGASPIVKDFLYHCFQKDPNLRVSAKKLLRHPWMLSVKKSAESSPSSPLSLKNEPELKEKAKPNEEETGKNSKDDVLKVPEREKNSGSGTVRAKKPMTVYDQAVQRVQEWNEALNAVPKAGSTRLPLPVPRKQSISSRPQRQRGESNPPLALFTLPSIPQTSPASAHPSSHPSGYVHGLAHGITSPAHGPGQGGGPGLLTKNFMVSDVLNRAKEEEGGEKWDDDFAEDITLSKLPSESNIYFWKSLADRRVVGRKDEPQTADEINQKTVRPLRESLPLKEAPKALEPLLEKPLTSEPSSGKLVSSDDDYSDMAFGDNEKALETKFAQLKLKAKTRRGIMHPDDIHKIPLSPISKKTPTKPPVRSVSNPTPPSTLPVPPSPRPGIPGRSSPSSRQNSLRGKAKVGEEVEEQMKKYTENEEEEWEDVFVGNDSRLSHHSKTLPRSLHLTAPTSSTLSLSTTTPSTPGFPQSGAYEEEDSEQDPFAEIDDDFENVGEDDMEANVVRDKRATLMAAVGRLIDGLDPHKSAFELKGVCDELLDLMENTTPEMGLESHFVAHHGMMAVLEVLESRLSREVAVRLLRLVNLIVGSDVEMLESFCLIGGIPVIIPYTSKKHSLEIRLEASTFIQHLTASPLTLQMFISCRGLRILVELLDEDYVANSSLVGSALEGIKEVFELQSPTPRNDFVRMFVREGVIDPLSTALLAILKDLKGSYVEDEKEKEKDAEGMAVYELANRAVGVLLLFCQVAQADGRVQEAFAARTIMIRLLKACGLLPRKLLITAIKAIKHLSTSPQLIEVLQNSNAMDILVELLGKSIKGSHSNEICSHLFQTIYSMTRLSKSRQEEAASSGIIPLLKRVIQNKSPLKQFALPILCDLANAGKGSRRLLWQNDGLRLYLDLLQDPYWRVSALDSILSWMQDETARVEDVLLEQDSCDSLAMCFVQASGVSFEGILDPFLKILRLSTSLTSSLSHPPFFSRLSDSLERSSKAVTKLNLLRLTKAICESHPDRQTLVERFSLADIVERLSRQDGAVLVRELAKEVLPGLLFGSDVPDLGRAVVREELDARDGSFRSSREKSDGRRETSSQLRRALSENVVSDILHPHPRPERPVPALPSTISRATGSGSTRHGASSSISTFSSSSSGSSRGAHRLSLRPVSHTNNASLSSSPSTSLSSRGRISPLPPLTSARPYRQPSSSFPQPMLVPLADKDAEKGAAEKPKHKRRISRSQLKDMQWQTDENGNVRKDMGRVGSRLSGFTIE
ncbi:STE/STE11/CDC15 protein kinase [Cryptococcus wingfieldii CBS 7118]|uniref:non-specific serine/threonine protein kinase n=1 Tax=Cryptococcus wingfieldii CBS 7118 TaxID=1295528 RepID=A0A1E3HH08_9TREE|nr:STE/STE11/CDC15 protein kinase [Cryptococcus wingfieldii CBS 7118]ODN75633.1 STE/STE11/CDC15 protein kinase [Cryptococcus wingfieldii CBS 7118]